MSYEACQQEYVQEMIERNEDHFKAIKGFVEEYRAEVEACKREAVD